MKKIFSIVSVLALVSFTHEVLASDELCLEGSNDCTFVLLSTKVSKQVSETISEANRSNKRDKVIQGSSYSEENEMLSLINESRAKQRLSPFSTFKIPNSLIALDNEQIADTKQILNFDKEKYPVKPWWPSVWKMSEYNLASAFKFSMVAIYRQMAMNTGKERMQSYLTSFDYGNRDISSGLDSFWLNGSMKISALEQVKFLQKMNQGKLPLNKHSITALKEVMLVEKNDNYSLYAKTGAGKANANDKSSKIMLGWYIGFVENVNGVHYFAFNFTRDNYAKMKSVRVEIARNHLKKAGVI